MTFSDSATGSTGALQIRLRKSDTGTGAVLFTDTFGITWSASQLYHHVCGPWHDLAPIHCGYGWGDTCQFDWLHSEHVHIKTLELEFGSSDPGQARFFRGRLDVPATYSGTPTINTWFKIGTSVGLATWKYPDAKFIRTCVVFTDSTSGGVLKVRLRRRNGGAFFEDNMGGTWSASGLIHAECGSWHDITGVSCGYSWGDTCDFEVAFLHSISK